MRLRMVERGASPTGDDGVERGLDRDILVDANCSWATGKAGEGEEGKSRASNVNICALKSVSSRTLTDGEEEEEKCKMQMV